jgi:hypothetical protein
MRNELSLLRNLWPVVFLGTALVSGCERVDAVPLGPSGTGVPGAVERALEEGGLPNLVVSSLESPDVVPHGIQFGLRVKVCNQGTVPAEGRVRFTLSPTPEASPGSGIDLGETSLGALAPGQCLTREQPAHSWQPEGGHYVVAVADADGVVAESSEVDNSRSHRLWIGQRAALVVTALKAPPHVRPGEELPIQLTMCNQGTAATEAHARFYLSMDASISSEDTALASTSPRWLEPGSCTTWEGSMHNPMPEGRYFLGAVVPPLDSQDEGSATSGRPFVVGEGPDLIVSAMTAPVSTESHTPFTSSVTVCNQGSREAGGFLHLYLSQDAELSPWEEVYGGYYVSMLPPGQCSTGDVQVTVPSGSTGAWYAGARVESWDGPELLEDNNTRLSGPIGVGSLPDFIVSGLTVPATVNPAVPFTSSITVCNQGTQPGETDVELSVVSAPDEQPLRFIEGLYLGSLEAGQCVTREVSVQLGYLGNGPFHLWARTDAGNQRWELLEDNNTRASERLDISWL